MDLYTQYNQQILKRSLKQTQNILSNQLIKSMSKAYCKRLISGDSEAETDEEEGHIEDADNRERDRAEESEENSNKESGESDEEVSVSLLRARNLSLLQSQ